MEATIEEILARVEVPDADAARERAVVAILAELSAEPRKKRRRRFFGLMLSIGAGTAVAISPAGQAIADFFTGGDSPSELSAQDRALTDLACKELGAAAAETSWCAGDESGDGASAESLLEDRGYQITRVGPAMAIRSPDGTTLVTGLDELDPSELPGEIGGVKIDQTPDQP
jgi:hypothetical protein